MKVFDFFATLLESVTIIHKFHLESDEYSGHMALDEYYEDAPDIIDDLIESYQGKYNVEKQGDNQIKKSDNVIDYLNQLLNCIKDNIVLFDEEKDSELLSTLDDLSNLIDSTLYKLKRLGKKVKENRYFKMKGIKEFIMESLDQDLNDIEYFYEDEDSGEIESEDDFREYAENKFKEVFGDELDEDRMNKVIDGLIDDNPELVDDGEWGELIGMLNKSFA